MPSSTVSTFTDPDAYYAAIRAQRVDGVVTARGNFRAELMRIDLHRLWMQRGEESLAGVLKFASSPHRIAMFFAIGPSQPVIHLSGMELSEREVIAWGLDLPRHFRSSAAFRWGAMTLPEPDLVAAASAIAGRELIPPGFARRIRPPAPLLLRLRNLHEAASHLAKTTPDILANTEVARAIENSLVEVMVECLASDEVVEVTHYDLRRRTVIRRLEELLQANSEEALYISELCAAVGVSYPTLRASCQEHLGMSPKRYLLLRRMHLARRALRRADPEKSTVTEIATQYGFWEFGRFSVAYRSLFGESPSTTLRRPPEDPKPGELAGSPWQFTKSA